MKHFQVSILENDLLLELGVYAYNSVEARKIASFYTKSGDFSIFYTEI